MYNLKNLPDPTWLISNRYSLLLVFMFVLVGLYIIVSAIRKINCKSNIHEIAFCSISIFSSVYVAILCFLIIVKNLTAGVANFPPELFVYSAITGIIYGYVNIIKYASNIIALFKTVGADT